MEVSVAYVRVGSWRISLSGGGGGLMLVEGWVCVENVVGGRVLIMLVLVCSCDLKVEVSVQPVVGGRVLIMLLEIVVGGSVLMMLVGGVATEVEGSVLMILIGGVAELPGGA